MNRQQALQILHAALPELKRRFAIEDRAIFGSVARNEAREDSDVDVLVTFQGPARFREFMRLQFKFESLLDRKVHLVTSKALRPALRPGVERDLIHVA